ncbi:hypothetical protein ZWY2020_021581 [Hordeum vulgare]|nr:hypothetical protein ZWY2020_021581 [Hordeum vulgare]
MAVATKKGHDRGEVERRQPGRLIGATRRGSRPTEAHLATGRRRQICHRATRSLHAATAISPIASHVSFQTREGIQGPGAQEQRARHARRHLPLQVQKSESELPLKMVGNAVNS